MRNSVVSRQVFLFPCLLKKAYAIVVLNHVTKLIDTLRASIESSVSLSTRGLFPRGHVSNLLRAVAGMSVLKALGQIACPSFLSQQCTSHCRCHFDRCSFQLIPARLNTTSIDRVSAGHRACILQRSTAHHSNDSARP